MTRREIHTKKEKKKKKRKRNRILGARARWIPRVGARKILVKKKTALGIFLPGGMERSGIFGGAEGKQKTGRTKDSKCGRHAKR